MHVVFMMKRYPKKRVQQPSPMMSLFGLNSSQKPSSISVSNTHNDQPSSALSEIKTIWHAMKWLFFHKQYAGVGIALAEYATKTAFSYLPKHQAAYYRKWLKFLGMDVDSIGIADISGSVLNLTFPGIANVFPLEDMFPHTHATPPPPSSSTIVGHIVHSHDSENTLTDTLKSLLMKGPAMGGGTLSPFGKISDVVSSLIHRVQSLTKIMPPEIQRKGHDEFADYLCGESGWSSGNAKASPDAIANKALQCYSDSHWFDVGLSTLNQMLANYKKTNPGVPPKSTVILWLKQAYTFWTKWGAQWAPSLRENADKVVNELAKAECDDVSRKTRMASTTQGMFIAHAQSTNANAAIPQTRAHPTTDSARYHHPF